MHCHAVIQQVPRQGGGGENRTGSTVGLELRSTDTGPETHSHAAARFQSVTVLNTKPSVRYVNNSCNRNEKSIKLKNIIFILHD